MSRAVKIGVGLASLALLIGLNRLAWRYLWYWHYPYADIPMHFLGGAAVAAWFSAVWQKVRPWWLVGLAAVAVGLVWEFFEFSFHDFWPAVVRVKTLPMFERGFTDTVSDLTFDCLGALLAYLALNNYGRRKEIEA